VLSDFVANRLIAKTEGGELAAQLLLFTAYDNAVKN
jgi:hypothetical protein